jgi:hypothetical protein
MQTRSWYGQPSDFVGAEGQRNHSPVYDFVKDILLPAVPLAGMFLSWNSPWRLGAFLLATVFLGSLGLYPRVKTALTAGAERSQDDKVAKREFPKFRQFVRRFGEFEDSRTNTTLHYVVANDLGEPLRSELLTRLGIPNIGFWSDRLHFFSQRVTRQESSVEELELDICEFHSIVGDYNNYCVAPIFQHLPKALRDKLTDEDRSKLNGFHLRYMHFIADYEAFAKELSEARPRLQRLPSCFAHSNPL